MGGLTAQAPPTWLLIEDELYVSDDPALVISPIPIAQ